MNKKITVVTIFILMVSVFLCTASKRDEYLKAVSEKDPQAKFDLLKQYLDKYGKKKDKLMKFIYLNLSDTAYKLKYYDETIQYGESALQDPEVDPGNKLRVYFSLANSYYVTKKDFDKAIQYSQSIIDLCKMLMDQAEKSDNQEQAQQTINNYKKFYISPAYQIQAKSLFTKGKDNPENILQAAEKALEAYKLDLTETSSKMVFSLAGNLYRKGKKAEAVKYVEAIFNKEKPDLRQANFLATTLKRMKQKERALYYYEIQYRLKPKAGLAKRIGVMVHKKNNQKGLKYFSDAFVLGGCNKGSEVYRFLEHLYFNIITKGQKPEEQEQGFKEVIKAAEARTGKTCGGGDAPAEG